MKKMTVRNVTSKDVERILEIYAYYIQKTAITFEYEVPALTEFRNRIKNIMKRYPYLVIEKDGIIQGFAYASAFVGRKAYDWSCEMTVYIAHDSQKNGFGRLLYTELENRLKNIGISNLYACIAYPEIEDEYLTKNSAEFHFHLGFSTVGTFKKCGYKFERWYNMIWMEKIIGEHLKKQPPVNFSQYRL